jgi:4-amino-4-deoxy-L-arabinose transferase-like glycosyltransferase
MTDFLDGAVALLVAVILNAWIVRRIRQNFPGDESAFLVRVYLWTLALRFILAVFLNIYSGNSTFADAFWGDSSTYDGGGYLLARSWAGELVVNPYLKSVSGYGFYYFVGAIYYVFGRNQLLVQFVNGTLGSLTVLVIYVIARSLFGAPVAKWAARFMAFFPQMVFWSGALYKDTAIMLCIAVCMYAVLRLRENLSTRNFALFIAGALSLITLRFYVFYFVAFATLGTFVFSQRRGLLGSLFSQVLLVGAFLGAFSFVASREVVEEHVAYFDLKQIQEARSDQAMQARSAFGAERDVSSTEGAIRALPGGLVFLLFAPFPWAITGLRQLLTLPETLVWYALMPAFATGLAYTMRYRVRACLPILVFTASLTTAYAVFQGNIGTAYRQRTQITMFFFIFMGVGIEERKRQRDQRIRINQGLVAVR